MISVVAVSPQGIRQACDDESNASYVLTLPGSVMDLTSPLNNKKFRGRGNKEGAIRVFQLLHNDDLGDLETRHGRSHSKVCLISELFSFSCSKHLHVFNSVSNSHHSTFFPQLYQFRKRPLPPPDDEEQSAELATKLMKYNVSLPAYVSAFEDVNNPW